MGKMVGGSYVVVMVSEDDFGVGQEHMNKIPGSARPPVQCWSVHFIVVLFCAFSLVR